MAGPRTVETLTGNRNIQPSTILVFGRSSYYSFRAKNAGRESGLDHLGCGLSPNVSAGACNAERTLDYSIASGIAHTLFSEVGWSSKKIRTPGTVSRSKAWQSRDVGGFECADITLPVKTRESKLLALRRGGGRRRKKLPTGKEEGSARFPKWEECGW